MRHRNGIAPVCCAVLTAVRQARPGLWLRACLSKISYSTLTICLSACTWHCIREPFTPSALCLQVPLLAIPFAAILCNATPALARLPAPQIPSSTPRSAPLQPCVAGRVGAHAPGQPIRQPPTAKHALQRLRPLLLAFRSIVYRYLVRYALHTGQMHPAQTKKQNADICKWPSPQCLSITCFTMPKMYSPSGLSLSRVNSSLPPPPPRIHCLVHPPVPHFLGPHAAQTALTPPLPST